MDSVLLKLKIARRLKRWMKKDTNDIDISIYRRRGMNIGKGCRIFSPLNTGEPYLIEIGDNVTISTHVDIITHDNSAIKILDNATDFVGKVSIASNCFIGSGAIILPGVVIGPNIIVAAGSVVTKSFEMPGIIVGGNPARMIGTVEELCSKNGNKAFNFRGCSSAQKKQLILKNKDKWLVK